MDKCLFKEVVDLFADDPETYVQFLGGRYHGKTGVERLYRGRLGGRHVKGRNGPVHGFLLDHPQMQGIVNVETTDGRTDGRVVAKGRFRSLMQAGVHISQAAIHPRGFAQWWEGGLYENEYVKDATTGVWKILRLRYYPFWHGDVEHGWAYKVAGFVPFMSKTFPEDPVGPDVVFHEDQNMMWPDTRVVPFHYNHPVTGEPIAEDALRAPVYNTDPMEAKPGLVLEPPSASAPT